MSSQIDNEKKWIFNRSLFRPSVRVNGISGFMRLRNEEEFLRQAIDTHLPFLDELIIVYNRSTDKTPAIAREYEKKFPDKVKVFHYEPYVYPPGSKEHAEIPPNSIHSLVNYYNFALSKTTKKIAVKIDGDHLAIPELFKKITDKIRDGNLKKYLYFHGVNLWDKDGKIYVNMNRPMTSGSDVGFFLVNEQTYFFHSKNYELFHHNFKAVDIGVLFFHLKCLKIDRGFGHYDLDENLNSDYYRFIDLFYRKPLLMEWQDYESFEPRVKGIDSPEKLNIIAPYSRNEGEAVVNFNSNDVDISIIVCTYNRADIVSSVLESLKKQPTDKKHYEIIVVDNNSTDNTEKVVREIEQIIPIKYICEFRQGLSYARNRGILEARGKYVAFIDDDAYANSDWLDKILSAFHKLNNNIVAVFGKVILDYPRTKPFWISQNMERFLSRFDLGDEEKIFNSDKFGLCGCNMIFRRDFFKLNGGFSDELGRIGDKLLSNEEYYILKKIIEKNYSIYYDPEIIVKHNVLPRRLKRIWFFKRYFWQGISDSILEGGCPAGHKIKDAIRLLIKSFLLVRFVMPTISAGQVERKCILFWEAGKLYREFGFYK